MVAIQFSFETPNEWLGNLLLLAPNGKFVPVQILNSTNSRETVLDKDDTFTFAYDALPNLVDYQQYGYHKKGNVLYPPDFIRNEADLKVVEMFM